MASSDEEQMFITCKVCDRPFTSIKVLEQHMKGKKHKKQVEDQKKQKQVNSLDGDSHLEEMKDSDTQDYTCDDCETAFSGIIPYTQHLKSSQHAKVLRRKKAEDETARLEDAGSDSEFLDKDGANLEELLKQISSEPYATCSMCEKKFSGPESYSQHMISKSHAKRKSELQLLKKIKVILSSCKANDTEETSENTEKEKDSADVDEQDKLKCKDCNKTFVTALSFAQHVASKIHKKIVSRNKLLNDLKAIKMLEPDDESSSSEDEELLEVLTCEVCSVVFSGPENMKAHIESKKHQKALKWMKHLAKKKNTVPDGSRVQASPEDKANVEKPPTHNGTNSHSAVDCSPGQTSQEITADTENLATEIKSNLSAKFESSRETAKEAAEA